jgi:hypothetical protein
MSYQNNGFSRAKLARQLRYTVLVALPVWQGGVLACPADEQGLPTGRERMAHGTMQDYRTDTLSRPCAITLPQALPILYGLPLVHPHRRQGWE